MSKQHASISQGQIGSDSCTCCQTETEVEDRTTYPTKSPNTDNVPTGPSAIKPGAQGLDGAIRDRDRCDIYRSARTVCTKQGYISERNVYYFRGLMAWFRFGILPLNGNM